jgi:uncharacterized BrkB/YihY/UPF0761 family membrane protein
MNSFRPEDVDPEIVRALRGALREVGGEGARSRVVNRTHRVVRDQALTMREQKQKSRSLLVPLAIFSVLLLAICYAIWGMLDGYDLTPNGIPDASDQLIILLLWSVPVTAVLLGVVWIQRGRNRVGSNNEAQ